MEMRAGIENHNPLATWERGLRQTLSLKQTIQHNT
jgi:hypothetical protein